MGGPKMINVRGTLFQENLNNDMGLEFYDLSHPWGLGQPCWPYFEDVKIERLRVGADHLHLLGGEPLAGFLVEAR